jgi:ABC-type transporter Mla MlaB component
LVFSLFGRKPDKKKPQKPPVKKIAAGKPADPPPSAEEFTEEGYSLDFTNYVPPEPSGTPEPAYPPSTVPSVPLSPADDPTSLDFASLVGEAMPRSERSEAPLGSSGFDAPQSAGMPSAKPTQAPPDGILFIQGEEALDYEIPASIEEAAVLFANGQTEEALACLRSALESESLGGWKLQTWLMIFDLLQHLGRKQEFEEQALEFVVKFERSAPGWVDAPSAGKKPSSRTGGAQVALSGSLGAQSAAALEQLKNTAGLHPRLRLDFAKLQGIEPTGCGLLRDTLRAFVREKKEVHLSGEQQLLTLLRGRAKAGDATVDAGIWLLLFDLYQMLGLQSEFEEAAVDYAVTYEVSPPSWDAPPPRPKSTPMELSQPVLLDAADEAFHVVGEVAGQADAFFADLSAYARLASPLMLDFSAAKRVDFVNAGRLMHVIEKHKAEGKQVVLRGAGEMIIALFAVMGIPRVARIIPRK